MAVFKAIIVLLPELISLIKTLASKIESGVEIVTIKTQLKRIDNAFKEAKPNDRARQLNDIFRGK